MSTVVNGTHGEHNSDFGAIDDLASVLISRHLQSCMSGATDRIALGDWLQSKLNTNEVVAERIASLLKKNTRVIAVVGAGAGYPITPLGNDLARHLVDELETDHAGKLDPAYSYALEQLHATTNYDPDQFELKLMAMARTPHGEDRLRAKIAEILSSRHPSILAYEMLAHLVKHRFIDAVINFNFDEWLDQSIEDELGPSEFVRIVGELDCYKYRTVDPDNYLYRPLYIKIHGTVSEPKSMRFTQEAYFQISSRITKTVKDLIGEDHCILMILGYAMREFDFKGWLSKPNELSIFHLDLRGQSEEDRSQIESIRTKHHKSSIKYSHLAVNKRWPHVQADRPSIGSVLHSLIRTISHHSDSIWHGGFPSLLANRPTGRHELVVALRGPVEEPIQEGQMESYLRVRAILEAGLAVAKSRGLVTVSSLSGDRCGRYFDMLLRTTNNESESKHWLEICKDGGFDAMSPKVCDETLMTIADLLPRELASESGTDQFGAIRHPEIDTEKLASRILSKCSGIGMQAPQDNLNLIEQVIQELHSSTEVEILPNFNSRISRFFEKPIRLTTHTALRVRTVFMMQTKNFDHLNVITETGEWLLDDRIKNLIISKIGSSGQLQIIIAMTNHIKRLKETYANLEEGGQLQIRRLRWRKHNRHLTLLLKEDEPVAGIFFARPYRNVCITPVYLDGHVSPADTNRLKTTFNILWDRSFQGNAVTAINEKDKIATIT